MRLNRTRIYFNQVGEKLSDKIWIAVVKANHKIQPYGNYNQHNNCVHGYIVLKRDFVIQ